MITMTFADLRKIKDSLPNGTMHKIADELQVSVETVRNYFGGSNFRRGDSVGVHFEQGGPGGGMVKIEDTQILEMAKRFIPRPASTS
ncbi:MAG: DNA-binding protein [Bacteroidota bacterium]